MHKWQQMVREFMERAEQVCPDIPTVPSMDVAVLRYRLINEELSELWSAIDAMYAMAPEHLNAAVADTVADLLYVVLGTAVSWGIDIEPVFEEVHTANMRKFAEGGYRRPDGKWMKPPDWTGPDVAGILRRQMD